MDRPTDGQSNPYVSPFHQKCDTEMYVGLILQDIYITGKFKGSNTFVWLV